MDLLSKGSHMVIIIDMNSKCRLMNESLLYYQWLDSTLSFANSHVLMSSLNKLTIIASNSFENKILYPINDKNKEIVTEVESNEGQYELFAEVLQTVKNNLKLMTENAKQLSQTHSQYNNCSLMSGSIGIALCIINKCKDNYKSSRIVIISCLSDINSSFASQYMNFMNAFFTSQKLGVVIDACIVTDDTYSKVTNHSSSILQQACDLTDGIYMTVSNISSLLQYLIWCFLPDIETRKDLVLPQKKKVSHLAACFCHRTLIDIGYVCSVCLSIFCSFSPICSTCHTIFKLGPLLSNKIKKKTKTK